MIDWTRAACRGSDPNLWERSSKSNSSKIANSIAREICRGIDGVGACPILVECTTWAFDLTKTAYPLTGHIAGWYEATPLSGGHTYEVYHGDDLVEVRTIFEKGDPDAGMSILS